MKLAFTTVAGNKFVVAIVAKSLLATLLEFRGSEAFGGRFWLSVNGEGRVKRGGWNVCDDWFNVVRLGSGV